MEHGYSNPGAASDMELAERNRISAAYDMVFVRTPQGATVLADIAEILHVMEPARSVEDMALQNAFKTILHRMGRWADDKKGAEEYVSRLLGR